MIFLISLVQNYFTINKIISNIMRIFYINSKKKSLYYHFYSISMNFTYYFLIF